MKIAAAAALLSLASCGFNLLDPVGDAQRRHSAIADDAMASARAMCGQDEACFKRTANAIYRHNMEQDNAMWGAVAASTVPTVTYQPVVHTVTPYTSSVPAVATLDICSEMSCPRPATLPVKWIPYTTGGGNPSGYGLLAR